MYIHRNAGIYTRRHGFLTVPRIQAHISKYRTRSNYLNILIIRTTYIIILFLSNSLNMLHLEFLTRSIRPNGHTPVQ